MSREQDSRAMFVARLEKMHEQGDRWVTVQSVLALLSDCDMLAARTAAPTPKQCDAETCEQGCACPGDCVAEHRTPFDVAHGPRTVHGQIATGYVVGVRLPDMDVLLFGATVDEARTAAGRLGGEVFGESMIDKRAMLIREAAAS